MPRVYLTRPIPDAGITLLREHADISIYPKGEDCSPDTATIIAGVQQADVLLSLLTEPIDEQIMQANPLLLGISNYAVGFNNIDVSTATRLGLPVGNTPGVLTDTTADLTWALILSTARRIAESDRFMRAGNYTIWGASMLLGQDVGPGPVGRRKTLGIIGFGAIGQAVARRSTGFNMQILVYDPLCNANSTDIDVEFTELSDLLKRSDIVSLHVPLSDATRYLIGSEQLALMQPHAVLVNTSRGPVIDEPALVAALRGGAIAGAGLDVYEDEPRMAAGLGALENTVLLPHIGSASVDTRDQMAIRAARNAIAFLKGEQAEFTVNPEVYNTAVYKARFG